MRVTYSLVPAPPAPDESRPSRLASAAGPGACRADRRAVSGASAERPGEPCVSLSRLD